MQPSQQFDFSLLRLIWTFDLQNCKINCDVLSQLACGNLLKQQNYSREAQFHLFPLSSVLVFWDKFPAANKVLLPLVCLLPCIFSCFQKWEANAFKKAPNLI